MASLALNLASSDDDELNKQLFDIIVTYEKRIEDAEPLFTIDGKKLEEICRTLPYNLARYDRYYQEIKTVEEWMGVQRDKIQASLWKKFLEGYPKALSSKDIQMYIQGDPKFVNFSNLILEIMEIKNKLQSIVKAFENMSWMVGHITKLRIAELQDTVL